MKNSLPPARRKSAPDRGGVGQDLFRFFIFFYFVYIWLGIFIYLYIKNAKNMCFNMIWRPRSPKPQELLWFAPIRLYPHGGGPEAHGAHGAPSASGPEIYPHGGSSRPIGQGPSAMAHRPRPMEPMGPHMGPWAPYGPIGPHI